MGKKIILGTGLLVLFSCSSKKSNEVAISHANESAEIVSLDAELKQVDQILEKESDQPSLWSTPERAPAGAPEMPGTPHFSPGPHGFQPAFPEGGRDGARGKSGPLEAFALCQPNLDQRGFGTYPVQTPYGPRPVVAAVSSAILSLALPSGSVSGSPHWDGAMVAAALGEEAAPGSPLDQAARANPFLGAAFDFAQGRARDPNTAAQALLVTALIRTSDNSECQRLVIKIAKTALQQRPGLDWIGIERQLTEISNNVLTGKARKVYEELGLRREGLRKTFSQLEKNQRESMERRVQNLRNEVRKSSRCRSQISLLDLTGETKGLNSMEQIQALRQSLDDCQNQVSRALSKVSARPERSRNYDYEERLKVEAEALQTSLKILREIEGLIISGPSRNREEDNLRKNLQAVESQWIAYHYFMGAGR